MYNHSPDTYVCPICLGIQGVENEHTYLKRADLVYQDELVSAFINSFWVGKNEGHVIVVPNEHVEHLYDLPDELGSRLFVVARNVAIALKESYGCDGVTVRQNNEPAGDQHAFHYHLHVFPRYEGDEFNLKASEKSRLTEPQERLPFAKKLREYFAREGRA